MRCVDITLNGTGCGAIVRDSDTDENLTQLGRIEIIMEPGDLVYAHDGYPVSSTPRNDATFAL